jgi:hypothetical protein
MELLGRGRKIRRRRGNYLEKRMEKIVKKEF